MNKPLHLRPLKPIHKYRKHLYRSILTGSLIMLSSLALGMWGYHYFESMNWTDAYLNASMILSGMGPERSLTTQSGKIFAGTYALFSGIIFLVAIAVVFAPILRRFLHKFHLDEYEN